MKKVISEEQNTIFWKEEGEDWQSVDIDYLIENQKKEKKPEITYFEYLETVCFIDLSRHPLKRYKCVRCKDEIIFINRMKYCPSCGRRVQNEKTL